MHMLWQGGGAPILAHYAAAGEVKPRRPMVPANGVCTVCCPADAACWVCGPGHFEVRQP